MFLDAELRRLDPSAYIRRIHDWMDDGYNLNMMMGWGIDASLEMFRTFRG